MGRSVEPVLKNLEIILPGKSVEPVLDHYLFILHGSFKMCEAPFLHFVTLRYVTTSEAQDMEGGYKILQFPEHISEK
jgi:hypothetical protein